jgi:PAS domain S-box-containing protein
MSDMTAPAPPPGLPGALTDLERGLPAIFDSVADGVTVIDRSGTVRFANEAAAQLMGLAGAADVIGQSSGELVSAFAMLGDDGAPFDPASLPTRRAFAGEENPEAVIRFRLTGRPEDRWSMVRARLLRGPSSADDLVVTSFQDISALKRTEMRLTFLSEASAILGEPIEYQEALERVATRAVPFIADWCAIDVIEGSNEVHRVALVQADPQMEDVAERARDLWPPDAAHPGPVGELLRTGRTVHVADISDDLLRAAARDELHLETLRSVQIREVLAVPLMGRGRILGALTAVNTGARPFMSTDDVAMVEELGRRAGAAVDAARLMFEAQEAVRLRDEFMATASHDMRTPLAAVRGFAQLARRHLAGNGTTDPAALDRWLRDIEEGATRLTALVSDVMDSTLLRGGHSVPLLLQPVDLVELVRDRVHEHQDAAGETHRFTIDGDEHPIVGTWDADRLGRVLDNVLGNAVKFSPGGGLVEVRLGTQGERGWVAVADHGIGIAQVDVARIFTPMFRGANARNVVGTGLGLAGSRRLVELMGGEITVQSRLGEGSTFTIWLPHESLATFAATGSRDEAPAISLPPTPSAEMPPAEQPSADVASAE